MEDSQKFIVFQVETEEYAIQIRDVVSIEKVENVTPIPHLPVYVKGIVKVRGELVPVLDVDHILYEKFTPASDTVRLMVLQTEVLEVGVVVNEAKEILEIPQESIKQVGLLAYQKTAYFTGIANLDSRLITIIDSSKLVQSLEGIKEIQEFMKEQKDSSRQ
ncbi:purine-binding chemotaxis protein CheW [Bacillaceae bacterium Marseille-Q3522]|nr:purine-binding chemotaxis protein CheW [Bacillaceae bacterium Marseille-Q3522]